MNEKNQVQETTTTPEVTPVCEEQVACDIATGKRQPDPSEAPYNVVGAKKDLNCNGRGPEWYRMVWRNGDWQYVSNDRLPRGSFRAADRRASVRGDVYTGEIVAKHDRGSPVSEIHLVSAEPDAEGLRFVECAFTKRRDGNLGIILPDGSVLTLPNPRK